MTDLILNTANPIVYPENGTVHYTFRDYLIRLNDEISFSRDFVNDDTATQIVVLHDSLGKLLRVTDSNPVEVVILPSLFFVVAPRSVIGIRQAGTGTVTLSTTGLTINGSIPAFSQHTEVWLRNVGTDEWDVM